MKRMFWKGAIALSMITALLFTGCDTGGGGGSDVYPESLSSTTEVWQVAKLNGSGNWVWLQFTDDTHVTGYFTMDTSITTFGYSYDNATGQGSITNTGWTPGAFSANTAGTALTFSDWGGHGFTSKVQAQKIADPIAEITAPSNTTVKTDATLAGTLYRGLAGNGKTVIFKFTSETEVKNLVISEATPNTYTVSGSAGEFTMTNGGWAPGAFKVINDGKTLQFTDYGGHGAGVKYFSKLE